MFRTTVKNTRSPNMMCYKDRTFCSSLNCKNDCGRKITEDQKKEAQKLELPIAYAKFCESYKVL
jgi:hypothetical protein